MANMSYCRMRNTEQDLRDCINHLDLDMRESFEDEELSMEEERAARRMIGMMFDFLTSNNLITTSEDGNDYVDLCISEEGLEEIFRRGDSDQYSA